MATLVRQDETSKLAKKVLNYVCGKDQLTEDEREYLKKFYDYDAKIVDELFVRSLVDALLKLEKFKVSRKKRPETTGTRSQGLTVEQRELLDLFVAHERHFGECREQLRTLVLSGKLESVENNPQVSTGSGSQACSDPRLSLLKIVKYCSERYLDSSSGESWVANCFFRVLELETAWLDVFLWHVEYFSRWISECDVSVIVSQACEGEATPLFQYYGDGKDLSVFILLLAKFVNLHGSFSQKSFIFSAIERSLRRQLSHFSASSAMDEKAMFKYFLWVNFAVRTISHLIKALEVLDKAGTAYTLLFHYFDNLNNNDRNFIIHEDFIKLEVEWLRVMNVFAYGRSSLVELSHSISPLGEQRRFLIIVNDVLVQYKELLVYFRQDIGYSIEVVKELISELILFIGICYLTDENCLNQVTRNPGGVDSMLAEMYSATLQIWKDLDVSLQVSSNLLQLMDCFWISISMFSRKIFISSHWTPRDVHFEATAAIISASLCALNQMSSWIDEKIDRIALRHKRMVLQMFEPMGRHEALKLFSKKNLTGEIFYGNFTCEVSEQMEFLETFRSFLCDCIVGESDEYCRDLLLLLLHTMMSAKIVLGNDCVSFEQCSNSFVTNIDFFDGLVDTYISALTVCPSSVHLQLVQIENIYVISSGILYIEEEKAHFTNEDHRERLASLNRKLLVVLKIFFSNDTAPIMSLNSDRIWRIFVSFLEKEETSDLGKDLLRRIFLAADELENILDRPKDFALLETRKNCRLLFQTLLDRIELLCFQQTVSTERKRSFLQIYLSLLSSLVAESRLIMQKMFRKTRGFEIFKAIFAYLDPVLFRGIAIDLLKLLSQVTRNNPKGEFELKSMFPANFLVHTLHSCYPEGISGEVVAALLEVVMGTCVVLRYSSENAPFIVSFALENNILSSRERHDDHNRLVSSSSEALCAVFKLIELTSVEVQMAVCNFLFTMTYDDSLNASVIDASGVTQIVIERLFCSSSDTLYWSSSQLRNAYLSFLCAVIRRVVTPSILSRLFSVLYLVNSSNLDIQYRHVMCDSQVAIFRTLSDSFEICKQWPRWFFDFSGSHSGLVSILSGIDLTRRKDSLWLTFWFRREVLHRETTLVELYVSKDIAVELFLNELGILCLRLHESQTVLDTFHNTDIEIRPYIWSFLCLRFQKSSSGKQTLVDFFLNGKHSSSGHLSKNIDRIAAVGLGCSFKWSDTKILPRTSSCLKGQFGAIYCFQGSVSQQTISTLYELGPSFDSDLYESCLSDVTDLDDLSTFSVLFLYASRCCGDSRTCPDGSSTAGGTKKIATARLAGSSGESRVCSVNNIIDSLHCIGGPKSVLELFFALDHLKATNLEADKMERDGIASELSESVNELTCCFLNIISGILRYDKQVEMEWMHTNIFEYLGAWFYDTKLIFSSKELVTTLFQLLEFCSEKDHLVSLYAEHCLFNEFLWSKMSEDVAVYFWETLCTLKNNCLFSNHVLLEIVTNFDVDSAVFICQESRDSSLFRRVIDFILFCFEMLLTKSERLISGDEILIIHGATSKIAVSDLDLMQRAYSRTLTEHLLGSACFRVLVEKDQVELAKLDYLLHSLSSFCDSLSGSDKAKCFSLLVHQNLINVLLKLLTSNSPLPLVYISTAQLFDLFETNAVDCVQWTTSQFHLSELSIPAERDEWKWYIVTGLCLFTARSLLLQVAESDLHVLLEHLLSPEFLGGSLSTQYRNGKFRTGVLPLIFMILVKENNLVSRASMIQALVALLEENRLLTKALLYFKLWPFWIIRLFQPSKSSTYDNEEPFRSCMSSCKKLVVLLFRQIIEDHGMSFTMFSYVEELVFAAWSLIDANFALQVLVWFLQCVKDIAVPLLLSRGLFGMNIGSKSSQTLENTNAEGFALLFLFTELICNTDNVVNQEEARREDFQLKLQLYELSIEIIFLLGLLNTSSMSYGGETKQVSSESEFSSYCTFPKSIVSDLFKKFETDRTLSTENSSQKSFKLDEQTFIEPICKGGFVRISILFIIEALFVKLKRHEEASYYESLLSSIGEVHGGLRVDKMWRHYVEQHLTNLVYDSSAKPSLTPERQTSLKDEMEMLLGNLAKRWKRTKSSTERKPLGFVRLFKSKSFNRNSQLFSSPATGSELIDSLLKSEQEWKETGGACLFSALMNWKNRIDSSVQIIENISSELSSNACFLKEEQEMMTSEAVKREAKIRLKASEFRKVIFGFRKHLRYQELLKNATKTQWSLARTMDTLQRRWLLKPSGNIDTQRKKLGELAQQMSLPSSYDPEENVVVSFHEKDSNVVQNQNEPKTISVPHLSLPLEDHLSVSQPEESYHKDWSIESPEPASASSSSSTPLLSGAELLAARTAASASDVQWSGTCIWVRFLEAVSGRLELRERSIRFLESPFNEDSEKVLSPGYFVKTPSTEEDIVDIQELTIPFEEIQHLEYRRFLLQPKAFEIFLRNKKSYFFAFQTSRACKTCLKLISKLLELPYNRLAPSHNTGGPRSVYAGGAFKFPRCVLDSKTVQSLVIDACARWKRRQLSNFEYLCILNRLAGRSNNDLCQYPIFPWILADYSTEQLDLTDPRSFRDLSKPVGCQPSSNFEESGERERRFRERFETWADKTIPPFHYGSHYSSAASVLHYLVRIEPFTTLSLQLQGGLFDHPDRMFYSIQGAWNSVTQSMQDVKELIPEFFYFPEIFRNQNKVSFGTTQDGHLISDVILPKWANGSPEQFVRVHREALESEYVSLNLHHWIDLIFGFRQRGPAAVEACNVFFYLTYEGAVDLESIQDMELRESMETQIAHFGQTPPQLLRDSSHPQRDHSGVALQPSYWTPQGLTAALEFSVAVGKDDSIVQMCQAGERILSITKKQQVFRHKWLPLPDLQGSPFTLETETKNISENVESSTKESNVELRIPSRSGELVGGTYLSTSLSSHLCSLYSLTFDGKVIISAGHWDCSIRCCFTAEAHKPIQSLKRHRDVVTCLVIGSDGRTLVTGSKDTTVFVWEIVWGDPERAKEFHGGKLDRSYSGGETKLGSILKGQGNATRKRKTKVVEERPKLVLYEHEYPIVCVAVNTEVGIIASNDSCNYFMIHNLSNGHLLRLLDFSKESLVDSFTVTCRNEIIMISSKESSCMLYTGNGVPLKKHSICSQQINQMQSTPTITSYTTTVDGRLLFVADELSGVAVYSTWDLNLLHRYQPCPSSPVSALCLTAEESILLAGVSDGRILAYTVDRFALLQSSSLAGVEGASNPFYGC